MKRLFLVLGVLSMHGWAAAQLLGGTIELDPAGRICFNKGIIVDGPSGDLHLAKKYKIKGDSVCLIRARTRNSSQKRVFRRANCLDSLGYATLSTVPGPLDNLPMKSNQIVTKQLKVGSKTFFIAKDTLLWEYHFYEVGDVIHRSVMIGRMVDGDMDFDLCLQAIPQNSSRRFVIIVNKAIIRSEEVIFLKLWRI